MISLQPICKRTKETEVDFVNRACSEISHRALESGQSLLNVVSYRGHMIAIWEITPYAKQEQDRTTQGA